MGPNHIFNFFFPILVLGLMQSLPSDTLYYGLEASHGWSRFDS
jgi:hypothetical protein